MKWEGVETWQVALGGDRGERQRDAFPQSGINWMRYSDSHRSALYSPVTTGAGLIDMIH